MLGSGDDCDVQNREVENVALRLEETTKDAWTGPGVYLHDED